MNESPDILQPRHWEKMVLAAYLLIMGESHESIGRKIGRTRMTLWSWQQNKPLWALAKREAEQRWLYDIKDVARQAVHNQLKAGDGDLGLKILERLDEALAPPKQRLAGQDGNEFVIKVVYDKTGSDEGKGST